MTTARPFAISILALSLTAVSAHADLKPVAMDAKEFKYVRLANDVASIKQVKAGDKTYRLVTMDSPLNGDVNMTSVLIVGDEVGGEAGFDAGFLLTPSLLANGSNELNVVTDLIPRTNGVEISALTPDGTTVSRSLVFDAKTNVLKEGKLATVQNCGDLTATNDVFQCLVDENTKEDKALNAAYAKAIKGADAVRAARIKASEKAWLALRAANCTLAGDDMRGGSYEKVLVEGCYLDMSKKRTAELLEISRN
ncbi:MAG: DUF1311 domain-containing protein [Bdellovibrionales bacterium]|nr:DUF1311 domain-containing protein [Bdellovibrionales bacterium]